MPKNETNRVKKLMALRKDIVEDNRRMLRYYDWNIQASDLVMSDELFRLLTPPSEAMQALQQLGVAITTVAEAASRMGSAFNSRERGRSQYVYSVAVDMATQMITTGKAEVPMPVYRGMVYTMMGFDEAGGSAEDKFDAVRYMTMAYEKRSPALIEKQFEPFPGYRACFSYLTVGCQYSEEKVAEILEEIRLGFVECNGKLPEEAPLRVMITNYTGVTIQQSQVVYTILKDWDSDTEKQEVMSKQLARGQRSLKFPGQALMENYLASKNYTNNVINEMVEATAWSYMQSNSPDLPEFDFWRKAIYNKVKLDLPLGDYTFCYDIMRREWQAMKNELRLESYGDRGRPVPTENRNRVKMDGMWFDPGNNAYRQLGESDQSRNDRLERLKLEAEAKERLAEAEAQRKKAEDELKQYSYDKEKYGDRGEPIGGPRLKAFDKPKGSYWRITIEGPANALRNLYKGQCVAFEESVFQIKELSESMDKAPRITFSMVHRPEIDTNADMPVMLFDKRDLAKIGINDFTKLMSEDRIEYGQRNLSAGLKGSVGVVSTARAYVGKDKTVLAEPVQTSQGVIPAGTVMIMNPTTGQYEVLPGVTNVTYTVNESKEKAPDVNRLAPVRRKINLEYEE